MRILCWRDRDPIYGREEQRSVPRRVSGRRAGSLARPCRQGRIPRASEARHHPTSIRQLGLGGFHPLAEQGKIPCQVAIMERTQLNLDLISVPGDPSRQPEEGASRCQVAEA
jgi:hypothetical protein